MDERAEEATDGETRAWGLGRELRGLSGRILTPVARNGASLRGRGRPRTSPGEHANRARRPTGFSVEDACH